MHPATLFVSLAAFAVFSSLSSSSSSSSYVAIFTHAAATYTNPVIPDGDTPDPGVVFDPKTGKYYAATTGGNAEGEFLLHESTDLVKWTAAGVAIKAADRPSWAINSFWAPEIHYINKEWTLIFTARTNKPSADPSTTLLAIGIAKSISGRPQGPYKDAIGRPIIEDTVNHWGHIDATYHYIESEKKGYLIFKRDGNAYGIHTPIHYAPLNTNATAIEPANFDWRATQLITNDLPWEGGVVEAPWVVLENGTYFLFYSGNGYSTNYAVGVARSSHLLGPYTKHGDPILHNSNGNYEECPGHCSVVRIAATTSSVAEVEEDGEAKKEGGGSALHAIPNNNAAATERTVMVYHAYHGSERDQRHVSVDVVEWVKDSEKGLWPRVHGGTPSTTPQPNP